MAHRTSHYKPCPGCGISRIDPRARQCFNCRTGKTLPSTAIPGLTIPDETGSKILTDSRTESGDTCEVTKTVFEHVRTLADLVRVCEIDLEEWEVERWVANKWEVGAKGDDDRIHVTPLFQVKATLKRRTVADKTMVELSRQLLTDIRNEVAGNCSPYLLRQGGESGQPFCYEFAPFDLHMGKFAWADETVANYDVDIAEDLLKEAWYYITQLALKAADNRIGRVLLVFGNDVSHVDSKKLQTTAGTPMDYDSRYIRVYRRITHVHRWLVEQALKIAPVDVVIVPGNHDELTSFHLGEVLGARFDQFDDVSIDNGPRLRKYYDKWGVNLLGFAHGNNETVRELPLTMAREMKDSWARCTEREWQVGHKHIKEGWKTRDGRPGLFEQDEYSDKGVRVRRLSSLSAHDAWHTSKAYMDRRQCEGFLFHKTAGYTAGLNFNVDHFTGKVMK